MINLQCQKLKADESHMQLITIRAVSRADRREGVTERAADSHSGGFF